MSSSAPRAPEVLQLVGPIYDAALDPAGWPGVLAQIARLTGSDSIWIAGSTFHAHNVDVSARENYFDYRDPWIDRMRPENITRPLPGRAVLSLQELRATQFYADYWSRLGYLDSFAISLAFQGRRLRWSLAAARLATRGEHADEEIAALRPLGPHLKRALEIDAALHRSAQESAGLAALIDRLTLCVLVVDGTGRIARASLGAEQLLAGADGLRSEAGGLRAARPADTRALLKLVGESAQASSGEGHAAGGWLAVGRPSRKRDLAVLVSPLGASARQLLRATPLVMVLVRDPELAVELPADALQRLWRLTPAESRLALHLANGLTIESASERAGTTRNTAKNQLARIFEKTQTHRQGQLVSLLSRTLTAPKRD